MFLFLPDDSVEQSVAQHEVTVAGKGPDVGRKFKGQVDDEGEVDAVADLLLEDKVRPESQPSTYEFADAAGASASAPGAWSGNERIEMDEEAIQPEPVAPAIASRALDVAGQSQKRFDRQLMDDSTLRRRSAVEGVDGAVPTDASQAKSSVVGESFDAEAEGAGPLDLAKKQRAEKVAEAWLAIDDRTIDGVVPSKEIVKRLVNRLDRNWTVRPSADPSDESLTLAQFRRALAEAGCDYWEGKFPRSVANTKADDLVSVVTAKRVFDFIVVASPEQLVVLRKSAGQFASMTMFHLSSLSSSSQRPAVSREEWDGSLLPREDGLDPPG